MKNKQMVAISPQDDGMDIVLNILSESNADGLYGFDIVDFYPDFRKMVRDTVDALVEWYHNMDKQEAKRAELLKIAVDILFLLEKIDLYQPNKIREIHTNLDEAWKNFLNSIDSELDSTETEPEPA